MLQDLLPAIIPSWRFFDRIGPAPRLEFALVTSPDEAACEWQAVNPRPARVLPWVALARLFWNPYGNEALFLVSCAERLIDHPTPQRADDLWHRIADIVERRLGPQTAPPFLLVRIVQTMRDGEQIVDHVAWTSNAQRWKLAARRKAS